MIIGVWQEMTIMITLGSYSKEPCNPTEYMKEKRCFKLGPLYCIGLFTFILSFMDLIATTVILHYYQELLVISSHTFRN